MSDDDPPGAGAPPPRDPREPGALPQPPHLRAVPDPDAAGPPPAGDAPAVNPFAQGLDEHGQGAGAPGVGAPLHQPFGTAPANPWPANPFAGGQFGMFPPAGSGGSPWADLAPGTSSGEPLPPAQPWHGEVPPAVPPDGHAQPPLAGQPHDVGHAGQPWPGTDAARGAPPAPGAGGVFGYADGDAVDPFAAYAQAQATGQPTVDPAAGGVGGVFGPTGEPVGHGVGGALVPDRFSEHVADGHGGAGDTEPRGPSPLDRARLLLRDHLGAALLAALVAWLAFRFGGYHPRHWTIAAMLLALAAGVLALRGPLPARRTPAAVALLAGGALTAWAAASIAWADASRHLAWDETARMLLYLAALAVGALGFGRREQAARLAGWLGVALGAVLLVEASRFASGPTAARAFVAGRLDAPFGYSNATAAACVVGAWLLVGASLGATRRLRLRGEAMSELGTTWRYERDLHRSGMFAVPGAATAPPVLLARACAEAGLALGGAAGLVACAWLAQSRGALAAGVVTVVVAFLVVPGRVALLGRLAVIAGTIAAVRGALDAPYVKLTALANAVTSGDRATAAAGNVAQLRAASLDAVHDAGSAVLVVAAAAALFGAVVALVGELLARSPLGQPSRMAASVAVTLGVLAVVAGVGVAAASGHSPVGYARDQVHACRTAASSSTPPADVAAAAQSHFRSIGTNRCDFWRVALLDARQHPVLGVGANNFGATYVLHRHSSEEPRQAHSLPLDLLAGLGVVGAALAALLLAAIGVGAVALARSGPARDPAACALVVAAAGWLVHASVDWLWNMPAASLPVWLGLGAVAGCASRDARARGRATDQRSPAWGVDGIDTGPTLGAAAGASPWRDVAPVRAAGSGRAAVLRGTPLLVGALVVVAATVVPQGLADHELRAAQGQPRTAAGQREAVRRAELAARADPTWAAPLGLAAEVRLSRGDDARAMVDAERAVDREPKSWAIRQQASVVEAAIARRTAAAQANRTPRPSAAVAKRLRALHDAAASAAELNHILARNLNPQLFAADAAKRHTAPAAASSKPRSVAKT